MADQIKADLLRQVDPQEWPRPALASVLRRALQRITELEAAPGPRPDEIREVRYTLLPVFGRDVPKRRPVTYVWWAFDPEESWR